MLEPDTVELLKTLLVQVQRSTSTGGGGRIEMDGKKAGEVGGKAGSWMRGKERGRQKEEGK